MKAFFKQRITFSLLLLGVLGGGYILYDKVSALDKDISKCNPPVTTYYAYKAMTDAVPKTVNWKAPRPQDEEGLWVYGLFQPPCFAYASQGKFLQAYPLYSRKSTTQDFAFRLLQLEQLYYPIVFEGYYQGRLESASVFLLYDTGSKKSFRLSLEDNSNSQLKCVAFHSNKWDSQKQCLQDAILELWDAAFQKHFALPLQTKLLLDSFSIVVSQSEEVCIHLKRIGDSSKVGEGVVCLRGVFPEYKTILLEYQKPQSPYSDYFYLSL